MSPGQFQTSLHRSPGEEWHRKTHWDMNVVRAVRRKINESLKLVKKQILRGKEELLLIIFYFSDFLLYLY